MGAELPGSTVIGSNNVIGHHAVVGVKCQDKKYKVHVFLFSFIFDFFEIFAYSYRCHTALHK